MGRDDKILELFKKEKDSYLSGEEISHLLGISRQALWKHIEKLRDAGYVIEAVPHLGYKLRHVPDKMFVSEIKWNLNTKILGRDIRYYETVGSTNNVAYELAAEGAREGTLVIANEQTKGKGRLGRSWVSPEEGGVYLSLILRPDILPNEVPKITLVAAVSAVKAIRQFTGLEALVKWPNDILISDRKAGGILTELKGELDKVNFVVLGMGINVNTPRELLPKSATSIKAESKSSAELSRVELVKIFLKTLEDEYAGFSKNGFPPVREALKSYSCTLGRQVSVTKSGKERFCGKAVDIDKNGGLVVELADGQEETFLSGDVTLIR
ncbi:MAG: biotin--[acetyl-CoA-carboxylase] ligase [Candidatus Omnitrophica bacterium]|nr:biotin--[acetyl-CoA-carboxylase] ligase [Candidatus Omnitrophota bacterium]